MTTDWIAISSHLSQLLLTVSPLVLLISVIRTPRLCLYLPGETLILLTLVYVFRYDDLYTNTLSLDQVVHATHLSSLIWTTVMVCWYRSKAHIPTTSADKEDEKEVERLTGAPEEAGAAAKKLVAINREHLCSLLFWSFLPTLYSGSHSLLARCIDWYYSNALEPIRTAIHIQLCFALTLLENNALIFLYSRLYIVRRASANPPSETLLETAKIDLDEFKRRMQVPTCIWAFLGLCTTSAALLLPQWVYMLMQAKTDEQDVWMYRMMGSGVQVVFFAVFLVVYRRAGRRKIQLPAEQSEQQPADAA